MHSLPIATRRLTTAAKVFVKKQMWWVVVQNAIDMVIYHGPDLAKAQLVAKDYVDTYNQQVTIYDGGCVYPEPKDHEQCQCVHDVSKLHTCEFGHPNECHYPYTCAEADCAFAKSYVPEVHDWHVNQYANILPSDRPVSPEDNPLRCSRCHNVILEKDAAVAVTGTDPDKIDKHFLYHTRCWLK